MRLAAFDRRARAMRVNLNTQGQDGRVHGVDTAFDSRLEHLRGSWSRESQPRRCPRMATLATDVSSPYNRRMSPEPKDQKLTVLMSDTDMQRLRELADAGEVSVSHVIR